MASLKNATTRVEIANEQAKMLPKILLLSKKKDGFEGLIFPSEDDVDAQRRDNAVKIREQLNQLNQAKGNELYLEWLERNQDSVDLVNKKISLSL